MCRHYTDLEEVAEYWHSVDVRINDYQRDRIVKTIKGLREPVIS